MTNPLSSLLSKLTVDEATALSNAAMPAAQALATGDGSNTSVIGAWMALNASFVSNAALFQKIGVQDIGALLVTLLQGLPALVASKVGGTVAPAPNPAPAPAPAPTPVAAPTSGSGSGAA